MESKRRNILWLLIEQGARFFSGILFTVIVVNYLGAEKFGALTIALSIMSVLSTVVGLGIDAILFKEIIKSKLRSKVLIQTSISLRLMTSIIMVVLIAITSFFFPENYLVLLSILSIGFVFDSFLGFKEYFAATLKNRYFMVATILSTIGQLAVGVLCVYLQLGLEWFVLPYLIFKFIQPLALFSFYFLHEGGVKIRFPSKIATVLLKKSLPMMMATIVGLLYSLQDKFFIKFFLGEKEVGLYAVGIKLVIVLVVLPTIISNVFYPNLVSLYQKNQEKFEVYIIRLYIAFFLMGVALFLAYYVGSDLIIKLLFSAEYQDSARVLSVYSAVFVVSFFQSLNNKVLILENLQRMIFYRAFLSLIVNGVLNLVFIPRYGIVGAAASTVISEILVIFSYAISKSTRKIFFYQLKALNVFNLLKREPCLSKVNHDV